MLTVILLNVNSNDDSTCYTDQAPDCVFSDDVRCTDVAPGYKEACCPRGTTCESGYPRQGTMRCHMDYGKLIEAAASLKKSTSSTISSELLTSKTSMLQSSATTTSSDISPPAMTATTVPEPEAAPSNTSSNTPENHSSSLPTATLIGIIVGAVVGVCLVAVLGWLLLRRRRKQQIYDEKQPYPPPYSKHDPAEMDASNTARVEMEANNPVAVFELEGTSPSYVRAR
ncbi:hypothetical protein PHISCL_04789 [Aspergillus sclerotialis]|uniref:Uncharacterized protein n=1 Tax=Aspergillus sclerotialis TaxID=2070753 RepID=A0A3A2ZKQ6_9EURO|nr:hypothetical protein PHISCL_04789 [Aspergillus sclerotialis]